MHGLSLLNTVCEVGRQSLYEQNNQQQVPKVHPYPLDANVNKARTVTGIRLQYEEAVKHFKVFYVMPCPSQISLNSLC